MSIRKRRLLNKRIKPKNWVFSYWFKPTDGDWQLFQESFCSVTAPTKRCVIPIDGRPGHILYPKLEEKNI